MMNTLAPSPVHTLLDLCHAIERVPGVFKTQLFMEEPTGPLVRVVFEAHQPPMIVIAVVEKLCHDYGLLQTIGYYGKTYAESLVREYVQP